MLNYNLTANKKAQVEFENVFGTVTMTTGVHYWEITIDKIVENDDIIIGIAQKGVDHARKLFESGKFWGWICAGGRAIYPDTTKPNHPPAVKTYGRD